eukprot:gnl/Dysnectes_brevis/5912_a8797_357.p1 GENE.gnl/Dysnectes_brevis/5912_a8797_357~~gnl/Dysnectes_brevis/5912_a8797_357.p1  ORF type:complete len:1559 (-),score=226.78 gnl/Dysnectes_brevis/5912_a8797_357:36-4712(-)
MDADLLDSSSRESGSSSICRDLKPAISESVAEHNYGLVFGQSPTLEPSIPHDICPICSKQHHDLSRISNEVQRNYGHLSKSQLLDHIIHLSHQLSTHIQAGSAMPSVTPSATPWDEVPSLHATLPRVPTIVEETELEVPSSKKSPKPMTQRKKFQNKFFPDIKKEPETILDDFDDSDDSESDNSDKSSSDRMPRGHGPNGMHLAKPLESSYSRKLTPMRQGILPKYTGGIIDMKATFDSLPDTSTWHLIPVRVTVEGVTEVIEMGMYLEPMQILEGGSKTTELFFCYLPSQNIPIALAKPAPLPKQGIHDLTRREESAYLKINGLDPSGEYAHFRDRIITKMIRVETHYKGAKGWKRGASIHSVHMRSFLISEVHSSNAYAWIYARRGVARLGSEDFSKKVTGQKLISFNAPHFRRGSVAILRGIAEGLAFLHSNNIVHGDIKPSNVLIDYEYHMETYQINNTVITDLENVKEYPGIAQSTLMDQVTPAFAAPEKFLLINSGHVLKPSIDIWSLGITAWWMMISGKLPRRAVTAPPGPMKLFEFSSHNYALCDFVYRCIKRVPSDRPTVFELLSHPLLDLVPDTITPRFWHFLSPSTVTVEGDTTTLTDNVPVTLCALPAVGSGGAEMTVTVHARSCSIGVVQIAEPSPSMCHSITEESSVSLDKAGRLTTRGRSQDGGFAFINGDVITVRLNMVSRQASWTKNNDSSTTVSHDLPDTRTDAPYAFAVAMEAVNDRVTVQSIDILLPESLGDVECPHRDHSEHPCGWNGPAVDLDAHLRDACMPAVIRCPNSSHGCAMQFCRAHLQTHLDFECGHLECLGCGKVLTSALLLEEHTDSCTRFIDRTAASFSSQYKGDVIQLRSNNTTMLRGSGVDAQSAIVSHPGFNKRKHCVEWKLLIGADYHCMVGVSPPRLVGAGPGTTSMPGSIGLHYDTKDYFSLLKVDSEKENCTLIFRRGDHLTVRLDMLSRTVRWVLNDDISTAVIKQLPYIDQPYVLAASVQSEGDFVTIESFQRLRDADLVKTACPMKDCLWTGVNRDLASHIKHECMFADIACPNSSHGCTAHIPRCEIATHMECECEYQVCVGCNRCYDSFAQLDLHQQTCVANTRLCSLFSTELVGKSYNISPDQQEATKLTGNVSQTLTIDHPGYSTGVVEWEVEVIQGGDGCHLGVQPPGSVGRFAGDHSIPFSISEHGQSGHVAINNVYEVTGFTFHSGDTITIRLDLHSRTVTWIKNHHIASIITRPLPQPTWPYVLSVAVKHPGDRVAIRSYRRLPLSSLRDIPCPYRDDPDHPCAWQGKQVDLDAHTRDVCMPAVIKCPNWCKGDQGCVATFPRADLSLHLSGECRHHKCEGCGAVFQSFDLYSSHVGVCGKHLALCCGFSPEWSGQHIHVLSGSKAGELALAPSSDGTGTVSKTGNGYETAFIRHTGFMLGVREWDILSVSGHERCFIGVSTPRVTGEYPGHHTMPGSVGLHQNMGTLHASGKVVPALEGSEKRLLFAKGDTITLRLDMYRRIVSWTKNHIDTNTVSYRLPLMGTAYLLAVGLHHEGDCFTITEFRMIS